MPGRKVKIFLGINFSVLFLSLAFNTVSAHPFNYSAINTKLDARGQQINLDVELPKRISDNPSDTANVQHFEQYFKNNLSVINGGKACSFKLESFKSPSENNTLFRGVFICDSTVGRVEDLKIHTSLFSDYFQNFDHFVTFSANNAKWYLLFTRDHQDYPANVKAELTSDNWLAVQSSLPGEPTPPSSVKRFFSVAGQFIFMGMKHIWTGYDHILFLISIILLLRSIKKILLLVSSFTIAHSITLILAGLKIVTISPRIVEPLIALSITYMAVRNIMILRQKKEVTDISERWLTTAFFGLIHGLGFASALVDANIPKQFFVPSLIFFNVGVELGQLSILAVLVPLLLKSDKLSQRRMILLVISIIIASLSTVWFFQRLLRI
jgi:hydrogenase/urease accessory protein HupE